MMLISTRGLGSSFSFRFGKYKSPIGLERLESTADLNLIETGFATALTPNYDLGASIHNSYFDNPLGLFHRNLQRRD